MFCMRKAIYEKHKRLLKILPVYMKQQKKYVFPLKVTKVNFKRKIDALKESAEAQKNNYEETISSMRAKHEEQISTMGEVITKLISLTVIL